MIKILIHCDHCAGVYVWKEADLELIGVEEIKTAMGEDGWWQNDYDEWHCPDHREKKKRLQREMANV